MAYGGAALIAVALAIPLLHTGIATAYPRRIGFATFLLLAAAGLLIMVVSEVRRAMAEMTALVARRRCGEELVASFRCDLLSNGAMPPALPITLLVTNQRLLVYRPGPGLGEDLELELDELAQVHHRGATAGGSMRPQRLVVLEAMDGRSLTLRMTRSTMLEFRQVQGSHLSRGPRDLRALVTRAEGPTPSHPEDALADMLIGGQPTLYRLLLSENYLRIIGDRSQPLADLWWYFHWEHMEVELKGPCELPELPATWRSVRLVFHGSSSLTLCGPSADIGRLRAQALAGGAALTGGEASPADA